MAEKFKSDDIIKHSFDQCVSDAFIKAGSTGLAGGLLTSLLFRRLKIGLTLGAAVGVGMALANCQNKINSLIHKK